jgi:hypothetical protein
MGRKQAVKKLRQNEIDVIFAVDIFNEGVDIPELDTVLFLRPTESYVVFLQQLGRGLRKVKGKEKLRVLDFIGNYKRAHYLPLLLAGENPMAADNKKYQKIEEFEYPEDCRVNFDFKLLDLFKEMKKNDPLTERMKNEYFRLKSELERRPMRLDLYQGSDLEIKNFLNSRYYDKGYLRFLADIDELTEVEKGWLDTIAEEFLVEIESTRMSKLYKIPVLKSLVKEDQLRIKVPIAAVGLSFMNFYQDNPRMQKDLDGKRHQGWQQWDQEKFIKEAKKNPVKYLSKRKFFNYDEVNQDFYLNPKLEEFIDQDLTEHFKDIVELRKLKYYNRRLK